MGIFRPVMVWPRLHHNQSALRYARHFGGLTTPEKENLNAANVEISGWQLMLALTDLMVS